MKARYYDPEVGRFYSNDQVGFSTDNPFSFNRYAYADNNPYKFVDPDGKNPLLIFMFISALTSYLNSPDIGDQPKSGMTPEAAVALGVLLPVERIISPITGAGLIGTTAKFANQAKLEKHFGYHAADFGVRTSAEYEKMASKFLTSPQSKAILQKTRPDGDFVRYNPATNEYGTMTKEGVIKTYFKPAPRSETNLRGYDPNKYKSPLEYYHAN